MKLLWSAVWAISSMLLLMATDGNAMPNFARKYGAPCVMCHTQVPKLNRTGYEFRLAGYRLPDEIGTKEDKFELGNLFAARLQATYTDATHNDVKPGANTKTSQLEFKEVTLYPMTGSWGGNFGSLVELSMAPDDVFEIENAFIRGVWGDKNGWFQARLGVMHPWEGFGASDRPLSISRPLFQKQSASPGSPFFLWNLDEMAAEVGYHSSKTGTSISGRIGNGIIWKEDGSGKAEPAQGGALTKSRSEPGFNDKSYQLVLNQFFNRDSGATLYYYKGSIPFPNIYATPAPAATTSDSFSRLAAYANWFAMPGKLNLLAGYGTGKDSLADKTVATGASVGKTSGYFAEADYHVIDGKLAVGARYDTFRPSDLVSRNNQRASTIFASWHPQDYMQVIGEYQHKTAEQGAIPGQNKDNKLSLLFILIF